MKFIRLLLFKETLMNLKKILIVIALASSFAACSTTKPPVVQSVEEVVERQIEILRGRLDDITGDGDCTTGCVIEK